MTKQVINHGLAWRIGDGKDVRIWQDNWLPLSSNLKVQTEPLIGLEDATVSTLINADGRSWNMELLSTLLDPPDWQLILRLHLTWHQRPDSVYWRHELNGEFTVKSCYYPLQQISGIHALPSYYTSHAWNLLWKLEVPPSVLFFLWKVATKTLPPRVHSVLS